VKKPHHKDIDALIQIFDNSTWRELHLTGEGIDLFVSKDPSARRPPPAGTTTATATSAAAATPAAATPSPSAAPATVAPTPNSVPSHWVAVRAPCLGTFYSAPKPGAAAFVSLGQQVNAETELCLVEVMKLFTSVRAGISGTLQQVLVSDAALVEFDQPLFYIEPDA
jgi:acetyl-CoA carboxylase biotin carboxyl carrier protein